MRASAIGLLLLSPGTAQEAAPELSGTALIDHWIRAGCEKAGVRMAPRSDDAEFMRRVFIDVAGVIPTLEEADRFLADTEPNKRSRLVARLLKDVRYAEHWGLFWSGILTNFENTDARQRQRVSRGLRERFEKNQPFDVLARDVVTCTGNVFSGQGDIPMYVFKNQIIAGSEKLPMALASTLTAAFMGIQIKCAECHDHPFEKWTQQDFYGMAAFFAQVRLRREKKPDGSPGPLIVEDQFVKEDKPIRRRGPVKLMLPGTKKPAVPAFLKTGKGGAEGIPRRKTYAEYLTSKENLQFARACVNRYWAKLFGRGIVHPPDDFSSENPPSHPELLDALAKDFRAHGYDLHWLIMAITGSDAYQGTSRSALEDRDPAEKAFALSRVRPLSPEQMVRSLLEAIGSPELKKLFTGTSDYGGRDSLIGRFRQCFTGDTGREVNSYRGMIPTALLYMNGGALWKRKTTAQGIGRIIDTHPDPKARIRALYLATVTREPDATEMEEWREHVKATQGTTGYEDVLWTLLNSSEFLFNH